jgi:hypothetical protein
MILTHKCWLKISATGSWFCSSPIECVQSDGILWTFPMQEKIIRNTGYNHHYNVNRQQIKDYCLMRNILRRLESCYRNLSEGPIKIITRESMFLFLEWFNLFLPAYLTCLLGKGKTVRLLINHHCDVNEPLDKYKLEVLRKPRKSLQGPSKLARWNWSGLPNPHVHLNLIWLHCAGLGWDYYHGITAHELIGSSRVCQIRTFTCRNVPFSRTTICFFAENFRVSKPDQNIRARSGIGVDQAPAQTGHMGCVVCVELNPRSFSLLSCDASKDDQTYACVQVQERNPSVVEPFAPRITGACAPASRRNLENDGAGSLASSRPPAWRAGPRSGSWIPCGSNGGGGRTRSRWGARPPCALPEISPLGSVRRRVPEAVGFARPRRTVADTRAQHTTHTYGTGAEADARGPRTPTCEAVPGDVSNYAPDRLRPPAMVQEGGGGVREHTSRKNFEYCRMVVEWRVSRLRAYAYAFLLKTSSRVLPFRDPPSIPLRSTTRNSRSYSYRPGNKSSVLTWPPFVPR